MKPTQPKFDVGQLVDYLDDDGIYVGGYVTRRYWVDDPGYWRYDVRGDDLQFAESELSHA